MLKKLSKEIDIIINSTPEELRKEFEQYNVGELTSFIKTFTIIYVQQEQLKNEMLKLIETGEKSPLEAEDALKSMYLLMQKIEDTVTVLKNIKNAKISSLT